MYQSQATENQLRAACQELERRFRSGDHCRAEEFFDVSPELRQEPESALDLIYAEFLARIQFGETPDPGEYFCRFPDLQDALRHQFQIHDVFQDELPLELREGASVSADNRHVLRCPWKTCPENLELLEQIARGSTGVIYKAWQKNLHRVVALKIVLSPHLSTPEQEARFRIEAAATARLVHPNIVQIFKIKEWESSPYLVLEYVDGATLSNQWQGLPQAARSVASLVATLAGAVHYAHARGVVHRDLRPCNILLAKDGSAKIIDFGLAKIDVLGESPITLTGQILGTPSYMAPEQAEGRSEEISSSVDVYALGAILYEGLTGRPPFRRRTILETLRDVAFTEPVPPRQLRPEIPRDLETICLKCLRKRANDRYATAAELADDLHRFQDNKPIHARPVFAHERLVRWCQRNPLVAALTFSLAVAVTALFLVIAWRVEVRNESTAEPPPMSDAKR